MLTCMGRCNKVFLDKEGSPLCGCMLQAEDPGAAGLQDVQQVLMTTACMPIMHWRVVKMFAHSVVKMCRLCSSYPHPGSCSFPMLQAGEAVAQVNELVQHILQHAAANWNAFNLPTGTVMLVQPDIYQGDVVVHDLLTSLLKAMNICMDLQNALAPLSTNLWLPDDYSNVPSGPWPCRETTLEEFRNMVLNVIIVRIRITRGLTNAPIPVGSYNYACMQAVHDFGTMYTPLEHAFDKCYHAIDSLHQTAYACGSLASSATPAGWVCSGILGMFD